MLMKSKTDWTVNDESFGSLVDWSVKMEAIIGQVNLDDVHNGADAVLAVSYCRCKNHTHTCGTCTTI